MMRPLIALAGLFATLALAARAPAQDPHDTPPVERAAAARAKLEAAGASVRPIAQGVDEWAVDFSIQGQKAGDAELAHLAAVGKVVDLDLGRTQVTNAGLKVVAGLTDLRRLYLERTAVGDAGLAHLKPLAKLEVLNLYGSAVSDAGLEHLSALKGLRKVFLWDTKVTEEGAAKLAAAAPKLKVNLGWKEPPLPADATCCEKAKAAEKACAHPCCVAAAEKGRKCFKCNPKQAETCCEKAEAAEKACEHPCCVAAAAEGQLCEKCNPPK